MKVLIVEDETAAYESLTYLLKSIDPAVEILGNTESVEQTVRWLQNNTAPDLIFMDIHLSDASAFLIFDEMEVEVPIIFTTAYDEYAIEAFKVNSIDYLLKPIHKNDLERAIHKFKKWSKNDVSEYLLQLSKLSTRPSYQDKLLIPLKDKLLPINMQEISFFYTTDKNTLLGRNDGKNYPYSKSLEVVFSFLDPRNFYRANKQFVINRQAVKNITVWFDSRLLVTLDREIS